MATKKNGKTAAQPAANGGSTFKALREFMIGEGKGPADVVTLDDIIHADALGGAAPDAKAKPRRTDSE